jgi:hypothetical protein
MTTEERLEKLEWELARACRHRPWLVGVLLAIGAMALAVAALSAPSLPPALAQAGGPVNEVRATSFALVDENGNTRASLFVDKDKNAPVLGMSDVKGKCRLLLAAPTKEGPGLSMFDENGKGCVELSVGKDGPRLLLSEDDDKPRVGLFGAKDGPTLKLYDENRKVRVLLIVAKDGPVLTLTDENGKARFWILVNKNAPGMCLVDENGKIIKCLP